MSKPLAVLISDVHYSLPTLEVADAAMRQAIDKATDLRVPLIVAGDLHDTKANLRAECVNAMVETFSEYCIKPYIMIGNHDKINEKSVGNSLSFLKPYATIINEERPYYLVDFFLLPYFHDNEKLRAILKEIPKGSTIIMHQGIQGSDSGEYIQDKSAINKEDVAGFRVISGHYHRRQTIKLPNSGQWDYIGNPYTLNFGEANDPPKGFQILMDDGTLDFVPTNLRKHVVIDCTFEDLEYARRPSRIAVDDLLKIRITASKEFLSTITKEKIAKYLALDSPENQAEFRLELIPTDTATEAPKEEQLSDADLLDSLIDNSTNITAECKERLKSTWKSLVS